MTLLHGAPVSGKPHLADATTWPTVPDQLALTRRTTQQGQASWKQ